MPLVTLTVWPTLTCRAPIETGGTTTRVAGECHAHMTRSVTGVAGCTPSGYPNTCCKTESGKRGRAPSLHGNPRNRTAEMRLFEAPCPARLAGSCVATRAPFILVSLSNCSSTASATSSTLACNSTGASTNTISCTCWTGSTISRITTEVLSGSARGLSD